MASAFHIHIDCENDNPIIKKDPMKTKLLPTTKENDLLKPSIKENSQRPKFAVLNNQANYAANNGNHGGKSTAAHASQKTAFGDLQAYNNAKNKFSIDSETNPKFSFKSTALTDQIKSFGFFGDRDNENGENQQKLQLRKQQLQENLLLSSTNNTTLSSNTFNINNNNNNNNNNNKNNIVDTSSSNTTTTITSTLFPINEINNLTEKSKSNVNDIENDMLMNSSLNSSITTTSQLGAISRQPLQEIKYDQCETPISDEDTNSPMSIDRSVLNISVDSAMKLTPITPKQSELSPRRKREIFFAVEQYQLDILNYFKDVERRHRPKYAYMKKQPDINNTMRTILVDWLVEVGEEYKLQNETLYLCISYIDRFLSIMSVVRNKLQLVGTSAIFIAAKYEEIYPPDVREFVYITDNTYTKTQVLRMEQLILKALAFDLAVPTCYTFLTAYYTIQNIQPKIYYLAMFLSELSLLECDPFLKYYPSQISAAALALARHLLNISIWSNDLLELTGYEIDDLKEPILHLCHIHLACTKFPQQAIQEKYKASKYMEVSFIPAIHFDEKKFQRAVEQFRIAEEIAEDSENHNEDVRKRISSLIFV